MRRTALAVILACCMLVPPYHAKAQSGDEPQIEDVPAAIIDLLDDYARAYREKDAKLLGSAVSQDLLASERKALANAREVPFRSFRVRPTTQFSGNLASPRIRARYRTQEVATFHIIEDSRIGSETGTYSEDGAYTFVREGGGSYGGWRLAAKNDLDVVGFFSPYHLWNEAAVTRVESKRFLLLTHPDVVDVMRPVLQVAESAYDRVAKFWPRPLRDRYVIIAPSTTDELGRIMHETVDLEKFVAFVSAGAERRDGWEPTDPRVFIHLSHLRRYSPAAQTEILAHELIHAVTREASGPNVPTWVEEGLANLGGGTGGRPSRASQGGVPDEFPSPDRFTTGPVGGIQTVYDQSQVAIATLEDRFGRDGLAKFYEELGSRRVVVGTEEYHVRDAVRESVGWTHEQWLAEWRKRLG